MLAHPTLFSALSDPTRLHIVEVLREGECSVDGIVARGTIHQSGVSRHLGILREAGIVRVRADGQRRLYSLRPEPFREIDAWIKRYRQLWEARLDRFEAELGRRQKARGVPARKDRS
jgi:DNA-binding transcriptional ArsR family regulator